MLERWTARARQDYEWFVANRPELAVRVETLLDAIRKDPFRGPGKPEPLKLEFAGWWSRRIDREHRLVYRVSGRNHRTLEIAQCRFHYAR